MKGVQHKNGTDKVQVLLVNNGGHDERTVESADMCVQRYGMERYTRVRFDRSEFNSELAAAFGQYSYGKIVIDKNGVLLGIDVDDREFEGLVQAALGSETPVFPLEGFALKVKVEDVSGGRRSIFSSGDELSSDMTATLRFDFELPEGWYVSGSHSDAPEVSVAYSGPVEIGDPAASDASAKDAPQPLEFSLKAPKGTPYGRYFLHGTVRFMACNAEGCLPPVELPWQAVLVAL